MAETVAQAGEFGLIARIDSLLREEGCRPGITLGIGDDAAAFAPRPGCEVLITCDCLVEGRHFLPAHTSPRELGRRAMAVNISDIGAMGGQPTYALVSLGLRPTTPVTEVLEWYRGFAAELVPLGAGVIGGNLTRTEGPQFIDVTLLGEAERGHLVRRCTARPGDAILVTGQPGRSAAGLRLLLHPTPPTDTASRTLIDAYRLPAHRAREGRQIGVTGAASAMIDLSDGFLGDLGHVCTESRVGADLIAAQLPISAGLKAAARFLGEDPLELFFSPSDDYELLITCAPSREEEVRRAVRSAGPVAVTRVGTITDRPDTIRLILPDGTRRLEPTGWDHFASSDG